MKKNFVFVVMIAIFVTTLAFNVGSASAKGAPPPRNNVPVVVLVSPYFNHLDEGTHIPASVNGMDMGCYVTNNHKVRCVVPEVFAGQRVTIRMTIDGNHLNFYVKVPDVTKINWA